MLHALAVFLARHATVVMAAAVVVGLAWQGLAAALASGVFYASIGTMYLSTVRLDERVLRARLRRPMLPLALVVWTTLVTPAAVWAAFAVLPLDATMESALLLIAATAPIVSVAAYCVFLGTDAELLMLAVLPATVLSIVSMPAFATLVGIDGLEPGILVVRLLAMVGSAMGAAAITRLFVARASIERHAIWLDALMVVFIVVVGVGVTAGLWETIVSRPAVMIVYFFATLVFSAVLQALTWLAFARFGARTAASAALVGGCRNMAVLLALVLGLVPADVQLILVLAQIQLFILPALMRPVYALFGVSAVPAS